VRKDTVNKNPPNTEMEHIKSQTVHNRSVCGGRVGGSGVRVGRGEAKQTVRASMLMKNPAFHSTNCPVMNFLEPSKCFHNSCGHMLIKGIGKVVPLQA
jgi:hypothetical protein